MWGCFGTCGNGSLPRRQDQIHHVDSQDAGYIPQTLVGDALASPLDADDHVPAKSGFQRQGLLTKAPFESKVADSGAHLTSSGRPAVENVFGGLAWSNWHT